MKLNFGAIAQDLALATQEAIEAGTVIAELETDDAEILAGQPATVTVPPIGMSINGVSGKLTGTFTFTPNEAPVAAPAAAEAPPT